MGNNIGCVANTRDRILSATLKIIGEEGVQNVTVRKIANLAKVNVASVNYYFGSKDSVINEALKYLTSKLMYAFKHLDNKKLAPKDRLRNFLRSYSDISLEYPDVFKNLINHSIYNCDLPPEYSRFIQQEGFKKLKDTLRELGNTECDIYLLMKIFQMFSGLAFPTILGDHVKKFSGIDYKDEKTRYEYVELLLKSLLS
jgi:AcrR family transcriptional regulator